MASYALFFAILALVSSQALARDPSPLQDFCVADNTSDVFVNGVVCKNPTLAKPDDFAFSGLDKPGNTSNPFGSSANLVDVTKFAGLNTIGLSIARIDFAPYGLNAPHTHPRASEILTIIEGTLYVGFVTSNPNKFFTKVLQKGDLFVFPLGLVHFQYNVGHTNAIAIAAFSSQNPGRITIGNAIFGSQPPISDDVLAKAFQVDKKVIDYLKSKLYKDNNNN